MRNRVEMGAPEQIEKRERARALYARQAQDPAWREMRYLAKKQRRIERREERLAERKRPVAPPREQAADFLPIAESSFIKPLTRAQLMGRRA